MTALVGVGWSGLTFRTKSVLALALIACAAGIGGWVWFLSGKTLQEADSWSSVFAGFAAVAFGLVGVLMGILTLRGPRDTSISGTPEPASPATDRSVRVEGDVEAPVITGDDNVVVQPKSVR
ncbi:hypothetical protein [Micromonospora sp. NPDC002575]|uniref:hypothetical protein n=1 Tax=Micromonospora sp. NPDC002575 TaxID=3364222 RepID=UPI0036C940C9